MERPSVVVMVASSLDGRISLGPDRNMWEDLDDPRLYHPNDRAIWKQIEAQLYNIHKPTANMLGSNSLVSTKDDLPTLPPVTVDEETLYQHYLPEAALKRSNHEGWLVVVDGQGRVRTGYKGEQGLEWHMLHLVSRNVPLAYLQLLRDKQIPYLVFGEQRVDLSLALRALKNEMGVNCLITTAGGRLSGALLRAGLVDEINVVVKPMIIGGLKTPSLFDSPELQPHEKPANLRLLSINKLASDYLWLRYCMTE